LKENQDEPDADKAGLVGMDDSGNAVAEGLESNFNQVPQEMLRNLPGITSKNYRSSA